MQKVTIVLEDTEDMRFSAKWECDPPVDMNQPCTSQSVYAASQMMQFLQELVNKVAQQNRDIQLD